MPTDEIERCYRVFRPYRLGERIESCEHCTPRKAEERLRQAPLREITWDQLGIYPYKAMTTMGDARDFRHFLPRILELYIREYGSAHYDFAVLLSKLRYAKWEQWPEIERKAITALFDAWLTELRDSPGESDADILEEVAEALRFFHMVRP